eukprot:4575984-Alexandrium_andersonii.AAC.1
MLTRLTRLLTRMLLALPDPWLVSAALRIEPRPGPRGCATPASCALLPVGEPARIAMPGPPPCHQQTQKLKPRSLKWSATSARR